MKRQLIHFVFHLALPHVVVISRAEAAERRTAAPSELPNKEVRSQGEQQAQQEQQQRRQQQQQQKRVEKSLERHLPIHPLIQIHDDRMPARFVGICGV